MNKFIKRTGAFFVVMCLAVSLLPSFALAADDGTVTIDFTTADITGYNKDECTSPARVCGTGFKAVESETTTTTGNQVTRKFTNFNAPLIYVSTAKQPWLTYDKDADPKGSQWTIEVTMGEDAKAGWYDISLISGSYAAGGSWYIYVDGQYAGFYDCYAETPGTGGVPAVDELTKLNTLYLTPDESGKIKVMFALSNVGAKNYARVLLSSLTLTPADAPVINAVESVDCIIPELMEKGATADIAVKALMDDSTYRHFGYTNSRTLPTVSNIIKVESTNENVVSVTDLEQINPETDETTFKLNAVNSGTATINVTAIIDGVNGEKIIKTVPYTITVPYADGSEIVDTTVSVAVQSENTDKGTVSWSGATVDSVKMGDTVEATATPKEGYEFKFWKNSSGQVLSDKASESFIINTNSAITAVFDKVNDTGDTVSVELYNANGMPFYTNEAVAKNTTFGEAIATTGTPTYTGFGSFKHWSMYADESKIPDDMPITETTRAVAIFNDPTEKYTVSVDGTEKYTDTLYGAEVTVSSDASDFSCWKLGEKIVSYDKDYAFSVWGNVNLTEVAGETVEEVPVAVLTTVGTNPLLIYSVPEGYTIVEAGILFGSNENITISTVDGSRAAAARGTGQFTAQPNTDKAHNVARGYLIYRIDATGETRVIYSK